MSDTLIAAIDAEIGKLQQVRALLAKTGQASSKAGKLLKPKARKHKMSAEGRARIVEAVRKRWAKQKRAEKLAAKAEAK